MSSDGKDATILQELRDVSNRHSPYIGSARGLGKPRPRSTASPTGDAENSENGTTANEGGDGNAFLTRTGENADLNQYWYSKATIETLCAAVREGLRGCEGNRVAFLSTPSLFFSLTPRERKHCTLFDFDTAWDTCPNYQFYDYHDPTNLPTSLHGAFDLVVIDPPFISPSVWENYAATAHLLLAHRNGPVLATTVDENASLMNDLFGCRRVAFRPSIPTLVYQYSAFANFPSAVLDARNPELPADD